MRVIHFNKYRLENVKRTLLATERTRYLKYLQQPVCTHDNNEKHFKCLSRKDKGTFTLDEQTSAASRRVRSLLLTQHLANSNVNNKADF